MALEVIIITVVAETQVANTVFFVFEPGLPTNHGTQPERVPQLRVTHWQNPVV
jgi:hypothetical protein